MRAVGPRRLVGVDAARGLALVGMMSVHVLPATDPDGSQSLAYAISSGRASALFAVLAGVGLALARVTVPGVLARAAVVAAVGLTLGLVPTPVAVILTHYGLLFCCAAPFLRLRARPLAVLAAAWLLVSPVVAQALRAVVPPGPGPNPSWLSLGEPGQLLSELLLTGYYPVLQWTGYVLAGLAVGKLPLRRTDVAVGVLAAGAVLASAAKLTSAVLLGPLGGASSVDAGLRTYGTTPHDTWWWLAVAMPHSGSPPDLLHTTGTALMVLGACLLVAARWPAPLAPLAAGGSMTLTLYTVHVVTLGLGYDVLLVHVVVALAVATLWRWSGRRGPLEAVAAGASRAVSGTPAAGRGA